MRFRSSPSQGFDAENSNHNRGRFRGHIKVSVIDMGSERSVDIDSVRENCCDQGTHSAEITSLKKEL